MTKYLLLAIMALAPSFAHADGRPTFEVGYSTWGVSGVICTTGTIVNLSTDAYKPTGWHGKVAGYLIQNQDSADSIYLGGPDVDGTDGSGLKVAAGKSWSVYLGREKHNINNRSHVYCEAESGAGAAAVQVVVVWFGY